MSERQFRPCNIVPDYSGIVCLSCGRRRGAGDGLVDCPHSEAGERDGWSSWLWAFAGLGVVAIAVIVWGLA